MGKLIWFLCQEEEIDFGSRKETLAAGNIFTE
jgi:hypothetical protein